MTKSIGFVRARLVIAAVGLALAGQLAAAQSYSRGQNISPAFEGWEENPDGSRSFLFGYMNRNWEEEIDVPVGAENNIEPGGPDQGQPTHFLPRRNRFVFRVPVPKDFKETDEMIWTLTTKGKTEKAYATLRTDYKVDDVVKASETGALGAGTSSPEVRANKPPVVKIEGEMRRTAKVGQPLQLVMHVADDGIPKPRNLSALAAAAAAASQTPRSAEAGGRDGAAAAGGPAAGGTTAPGQAGRGRPNPAYSPPSRVTVGKTNGLHAAWFVYRGAGKVTFDPPQVEPWEDTRTGANSPWAPLWQPPSAPADGRWMATATFSEPGTYVLRAHADDGALTDARELTVVVTR
jgi:hypothetical protein